MIASTQTNHPLAASTRSAKTTTPVEFACAKLKSAGLRITQPRLAIVAALVNRAAPTSIEQIHEDLGSSTCDLVTVYRCMAAFTEIGLVRRAFYHNGTSLYEINLGEPTRYHVVCTATNQVDELDPETASELRHTLTQVEEKLRARGYTGVSHIVEFFGIAPAGAPRAATPEIVVVNLGTSQR
jgi:Fur family ferric uptake transcriptional regulator